MELETLKIYIKTHLRTRFIQPLKSLVSTPILFDKKPDSSIYLCVNYQSLNNLIIKNQFPLSLISKLLDRPGQAKSFTQLDLTNAYHCIRIKEDNVWKTVFQTRYSYFEY